MAKARKTSKSESESTTKLRPALTPEAEENQMIALAYEVAKQQLLDGTASSQVITHFLKLGSSKEKLEREKLEEENKLLKAKTKAYEDAEEIKELYSKAMTAFKTYSGQGRDSEEYDDY